MRSHKARTCVPSSEPPRSLNPNPFVSRRRFTKNSPKICGDPIEDPRGKDSYSELKGSPPRGLSKRSKVSLNIYMEMLFLKAFTFCWPFIDNLPVKSNFYHITSYIIAKE